MANLGPASLPSGLTRQFAGLETARIGTAAITAEAIVLDKISQVLDDYRYACGGAAIP